MPFPYNGTGGLKSPLDVEILDLFVLYFIPFLPTASALVGQSVGAADHGYSLLPGGSAGGGRRAAEGLGAGLPPMVACA